MKVSFILRNPKAKKSAIYLTVRWNHQQIKWSTDVSIAPDDWNQSTRRPKGKAPNRLGIVQTLNQFEQLVYDTKLEYEKEKGFGEIIPVYEFKKRFGIAIGRIDDTSKQDSSFIKFSRDYSIGKRPEMLQTIQTIETYLDDKDLAFDQIDFNFIESLIEFMKEQGLKISTINLKLGYINQLLNVAGKKKLHSNSFRVGKDQKLSSKLKKPIIALTIDELIRFANLDVSDSLELAKDLFLIGFYCGQRHSDYSRICPEMIKGEELHLTQVKTGVDIEIPLRLLDALPIPFTFTELLKKHAYTAPCLSYTSFLRHLVTLAEMAGIDELEKEIEDKDGERKRIGTIEKWKLVTSHTSRKSFCTVLYDQGMELENIAVFSGHKSLDTLQLYIGAAKEKQKKRAIRDAQKCLGYNPTLSAMKKAV
ncbi:MAG: phage integrase SAM-like domain-containing protein [Saprospiraceae bacterium]